MTPLSRHQFMDIPNRLNSDMAAVQYYVDKQRDHTKLWLYGRASNVDDCSQFPQEWYMALVYNLAVKIAPIYEKEEKVIGQGGPESIQGQALECIMVLRDYDQEDTDLMICPDLSEMY
jgi:hypothetical protein